MPEVSELKRALMADLITDARTSLRFARELRNGASQRLYGSTAEQYEAHAAELKAEYRALRDAQSVKADAFGYVRPLA